jgi:ubiquinone/menaquinone biosynthesis C-methylase UbiE
MAALIDPEEVEARKLFEAADFRRALVLEVGCGNGRLARRYAPASRLVVGIDPNRDDLRSTSTSDSASQSPPLRFLQANAAPLPFGPGIFDIVLFGWSL